MPQVATNKFTSGIYSKGNKQSSNLKYSKKIFGGFFYGNYSTKENQN